MDSPKILVFIRDIPAYDYNRRSILNLLMEGLAEERLYPWLCYSLPQILRYQRNKTALIKLAGKIKESEIALLVKGCNVIMRKFLEQALKTSARLILIDYISESIVEAAELVTYALKKNCETLFLKSKPTTEDVQNSVNLVIKSIVSSIGLLKQERKEIIKTQAKDERWHLENNGVFLNHPRPSKFQIPRLPPMQVSKKPSNATKCIKFRHIDQITNNIHRYCVQSQIFSKIIYDHKKSNLESSGLLIASESLYEKLYRFFQPSNSIKPTMIIVNDPILSPCGNRLIDTLMDQLKTIGIQFHLLPTSQLLSCQIFLEGLENLRSYLNWNLSNTCKLVFLKTFIQLFNEDCPLAIIDSMDKNIIDSNDFISYGLSKNWEIFVLTQKNYASKSLDTLKPLLDILRTKYRLHCANQNGKKRNEANTN